MAARTTFIATMRRCVRNDANTLVTAARKHWHSIAWVSLAALAAWVLPLRAAQFAHDFHTPAHACGAVRT